MLAEAPMYEPSQGSAFLLLDYSVNNQHSLKLAPNANRQTVFRER